ncbi:MAG: hypothetical protein AAF432_13080 [Planctomycetota bacterium]
MSHEHEDANLEPSDDVLEVDIIIGRLIDGEATDADRARFERLAALEPAAWRRLALQQADRDHLARAYERATAAGTDVELPVRAAPRRIGSSWSAAAAWAAVVVLALAWFATAQRDDIVTPDEALARYREAPFIENEFEPLILETKEFEDGSIGVRFMRRFEESLWMSPEMAREHFDRERGRFGLDPSEIRAEQGDIAPPVETAEPGL